MRLKYLLFFLLLLTFGWAHPKLDIAGTTPTDFNSAAWLEDFHQLLSEMSSHYANLEWAIEERKMDLPQLRAQTEAKLHEAKNEDEARNIIEKFLEKFGDGHLEIDWPKPQVQNRRLDSSSTQDRCTRLGYDSRVRSGINFSLSPAFTLLNTGDAQIFPGGLLTLGSRKVIGILRVGLLSEHAFPGICKQAVRTLKVAEDADCDLNCSNKIEVETANLLTAALIRRVNALRRAGASALLVDITHNDGGSNWVEAPARALSSVPLRDPQFAFIKHEHWTKQLEERLQDIETDLRKGAGPRALLEDAAQKIQRAMEESKHSCNRAEVWQTGELNCSLLVKGLLYTSGVLAYAKPGSFASLESRTTLFHPIRYAYTKDANRLPLYVLVDHETWSAAEYFAAVLQDNHAATIIGELTGGAGCGYTNGGIPTTLKNSGAQVKMPDCIRIRADGSDEVDGITPDVLVPWADRDSDYQRVNKLLAAMKRMPAADQLKN